MAERPQVVGLTGFKTRQVIDTVERGTIIPWRELSSEALNRLIEEFVSREGTEYGEQEVSLASKVREVISQLESGTVAVVFESETGTASVVPV